MTLTLSRPGLPGGRGRQRSGRRGRRAACRCCPPSPRWPSGPRATATRPPSAWFVLGRIRRGADARSVMAAGSPRRGRRADAGGRRHGGDGLVACGAVSVSDTGTGRGPAAGPHRQVNERWLDAYRPWVYGAGFGFQIGTGLATYITTAAVYLTVVLGAPHRRPGGGPRRRAAFGTAAASPSSSPARHRTPSALLALHRRFDAATAPVRTCPARDRAWSATAALVLDLRSPWPPPCRPSCVGARGVAGPPVGRAREAVRRPVGAGEVDPVRSDPSVAPRLRPAAGPSRRRSGAVVAAVAGLRLPGESGRARESRQRRYGPTRVSSSTSRRPTVRRRRTGRAANRGARPRRSHRCSSRNRSMPHSTIPTPMTMPAGGSGATPVPRAEPSEATAGAGRPQPPLDQQQDRRRWRSPPMAWKMGTGRTFARARRRSTSRTTVGRMPPAGDHELGAEQPAHAPARHEHRGHEVGEAERRAVRGSAGAG